MALGLREIVRRFGHPRASAATISQLEENRHRVIELALYYDETLPEGPEKTNALKRLQEASMWANVAVVTGAPGDPALPEDLPPGDLLG